MCEGWRRRTAQSFNYLNEAPVRLRRSQQFVCSDILWSILKTSVQRFTKTGYERPQPRSATETLGSSRRIDNIQCQLLSTHCHIHPHHTTPSSSRATLPLSLLPPPPPPPPHSNSHTPTPLQRPNSATKHTTQTPESTCPTRPIRTRPPSGSLALSRPSSTRWRRGRWWESVLATTADWRGRRSTARLGTAG